MPFPDSEYPSILRGRDKRESQRLLAAAPEMLDACYRLIDWVECQCREIDAECLPCALCQAQAAIAKAEGRE